jgi:hypothetical protein
MGFNAAGCVVRRAQDRRRMHRGHNFAGRRVVDDLTALLCDAKLFAEQGLSRGCTKADNKLRLNGLDLGLEPGQACRYFGSVGLLMDSAFAAGLPFEVFDDIGHVGKLAGDAGLPQSFIEEPAGGTDEGLAFEILFIAWLFSHQHHLRFGPAGAKYGLSSSFP